MEHSNRKLLVIGPKLPKDGKNLGGVVVLFDSFLRYLERKGIDFEVIDLNPSNYVSRFSFYLKIFFIFFIKIIFSNNQSISFHGTARAYTFFAPMVVFLAVVRRKNVTLRKFAGNFNEYYEKCNRIKKIAINFALKNADTLFFETKYLVEYFKKFNEKTIWFPNVRKKHTFASPSIFQKRFIYVGHIKEEKGIIELADAANMLNDSYTIDAYGFITEPDLENKINSSKLNYKGALDSNKVIDTMSMYDALILPSYREGYPGVIIEAFSLGLPIISTSLPSLKELVEDNYNGFLCEPKSVNDLLKAIQKINEDNYPLLSQNALNSFDEFDEDKVMKRIVEYL